MRVSLLLGLMLLMGCPDIQEGYFSCTTDDECPSDWTCRADRRCYSSPGAVDAGMDAMTLDAGTDAGEDAGLDADEPRDAPIDAPVDASADGRVDGCVAPTEAVDILLVIDDSGSMQEEQRVLIDQFPDLVLALTTGVVPGGDTFAPVTDIHVGVVTPNMGAGGFNIPFCTEPDDGVLIEDYRGQAMTCESRYPSFLQWDTEMGIFGFQDDFRCKADVGLMGCGFEQQLEAMLKAVTPSSSPIEFLGSTVGHADMANAGFLRDDSVLVTVIVSDESDCSAQDPNLFDQNNVSLGDLNTRCAQNPDLLYPTSRYADGLLALRERHRVVFAALAGMPEDIVTDPPSAILADPRMEVIVDDMAVPPSVSTACESSDGDPAFPGRRYVQLAGQLQSVGAGYALGSICSSTFTPFFNRLLAAISSSLAGGCEGE